MHAARNTTTAPAGNMLIEHPEGMPKRAWQQVTIQHVRVGQPRAYADSVYEYLVTFEGGCPSNRDGWDLPFARMSPPEPYGPGTTVICGPTQEEREQQHWDKVKAIMRALVKDWRTDNKREDGMGDSWLQTLEVAEQGENFTTYRLVVVVPYMD